MVVIVSPDPISVAALTQQRSGILFDLGEQQPGGRLLGIVRQYGPDLVAGRLNLALPEQHNGVGKPIGWADRARGGARGAKEIIGDGRLVQPATAKSSIAAAMVVRRSGRWLDGGLGG